MTSYGEMEVKSSFSCLFPTLVKSMVSVYVIGLDCRRNFGETYLASDGQCECELVGLVSCQSRKDVCYISLFIPVCGELKVVWKLDMVYQLVLSTQTIPQPPPKKKKRTIDLFALSCCLKLLLSLGPDLILLFLSCMWRESLVSNFCLLNYYIDN